MGKDGRRKLNFWKPFNDWWRERLDATGRRPEAREIASWYHASSASVWPAAELRPTLEETKTHAKCMRSLDTVREYFRAYRSQKRKHGLEDDADAYGHDTYEGPTPATSHEHTSGNTMPWQNMPLYTHSTATGANKKQRGRSQLATSDLSPNLVPPPSEYWPMPFVPVQQTMSAPAPLASVPVPMSLALNPPPLPPQPLLAPRGSSTPHDGHPYHHLPIKAEPQPLLSPRMDHALEDALEKWISEYGQETPGALRAGRATAGDASVAQPAPPQLTAPGAPHQEWGAPPGPLQPRTTLVSHANSDGEVTSPAPKHQGAGAGPFAKRSLSGDSLSSGGPSNNTTEPRMALTGTQAAVGHAAPFALPRAEYHAWLGNQAQIPQYQALFAPLPAQDDEHQLVLRNNIVVSVPKRQLQHEQQQQEQGVPSWPGALPLALPDRWGAAATLPSSTARLAAPESWYTAAAGKQTAEPAPLAQIKLEPISCGPIGAAEDASCGSQQGADPAPACAAAVGLSNGCENGGASLLTMVDLVPFSPTSPALSRLALEVLAVTPN